MKEASLSSSGYIEIPFITKELNEMEIDLVCNEESLLVDNPIPKLLFFKKDEKEPVGAIFGNLIFTSHDVDGNSIGLNDFQIAWLEKHIFDVESNYLHEKYYYGMII